MSSISTKAHFLKNQEKDSKFYHYTPASFKTSDSTSHFDEWKSSKIRLCINVAVQSVPMGLSYKIKRLFKGTRSHEGSSSIEPFLNARAVIHKHRELFVCKCLQKKLKCAYVNSLILPTMVQPGCIYSIRPGLPFAKKEICILLFLIFFFKLQARNFLLQARDIAEVAGFHLILWSSQ